MTDVSKNSRISRTCSKPIPLHSISKEPSRYGCDYTVFGSERVALRVKQARLQPSIKSGARARSGPSEAACTASRAETQLFAVFVF